MRVWARRDGAGAEGAAEQGERGQDQEVEGAEQEGLGQALQGPGEGAKGAVGGAQSGGAQGGEEGEERGDDEQRPARRRVAQERGEGDEGGKSGSGEAKGTVAGETNREVAGGFVLHGAGRCARAPGPSSEGRATVVSVGNPATSPAGSVQTMWAPGQEELFAELLGRGASLPGGCRWDGASVEADCARSKYACEGGEQRLEVCCSGAGVQVRGEVVNPALKAAIEGRFRGQSPEIVEVIRPPASPGGSLVFPWAALGAVALLVLGLLLPGRSGAPERGGERGAWGGAALCGAGVWLLCRAVGFLFQRAFSQPVGLPVLGGSLLLGLVLLVLGSFLVQRRRRRRAAPFYPAVALLLAPTLGWLPLAQGPTPRFGPLAVASPRSTFRAVSAERRELSYTINEHGFRGPGFSPGRQGDATRVALVGDSYVFGIGVEEQETLRAQLQRALEERAPRRRFEVLNLGIPGNNLASHVDLVGALQERLAVDEIIVGLTIPNDLSPWDLQAARRDQARPGLFSWACWWLGADAAAGLWGHRLLHREVTQSGLDLLDRELRRLEALRGEAPRATLRWFLFQGPEPRVEGYLRGTARTALIPPLPQRAADYLPGDGHPSPTGNARFAAAIARALVPPAP